MLYEVVRKIAEMNNDSHGVLKKEREREIISGKSIIHLFFLYI